MPGSFELQGGLVIDLSEVESLPAALEAALAGVSGGGAEINVVANTAQAKTQLKTLTEQAQILTRAPIRPVVNVDTAPAMAAFQKVKEEAAQTASTVKKETASVGSGFNMQTMAGGLMMMGIGAGGAMGLKEMLTEGVTGAIRQGRLESNISNLMGGGGAGQAAVSGALKLSKDTGFDPTSIMTTTANLVDMQEEMGTTGDQINALTGRIADIARSSGLPQYADNMDAVRTAISQGIASGRGLGLKQLGINIGATYMERTFEGGKYEKTYSKMDPAAQAQLRYQAVMEQTENIKGQATQASPEKSFDQLKTAAEEAGIALGKGITPALRVFAEVVGGLPKPVLAAGMVLGGLAALMIPLTMMGFGVKGAASLGKSVFGKLGGKGSQATAAAESGAALKTGAEQAAASLKAGAEQAAASLREGASGAGATTEASAEAAAGTNEAGAAAAAGTDEGGAVAAAATTEGGAVAGAATLEGGAVAAAATDEGGAVAAAATLEAGAAAAAAELAMGGGMGSKFNAMLGGGERMALGAGEAAAGAGEAAAGAGQASVLGTSIAGGMGAMSSALTIGLAALPAAIAAGLLLKYGSNMDKAAQADLDSAGQRADKKAAFTQKLYNDAMAAQSLGNGQWYVQGQQLSAGEQKWISDFRSKQAGSGPQGAVGMNIRVALEDRTRSGVSATDVGSHTTTVR